MKRPLTTEKLFDTIRSILKEKDKLPDILDYGLAISHPLLIRTCGFDLKSNLAFGGSEGIYLGFWIEHYADEQKSVNVIGIFKSLQKDGEAMHIMAGLLANFIIEKHAYVNANLDDFTWEGADVHPLDQTGKRLNWAYSCGSMEAALTKKNELLKRYPQVIVRGNATRKEKILSRQTLERRVMVCEVVNEWH